MAADIQWLRDNSQAREREEEAQKPKSVQGHTAVTQKWLQRLKERWAHLNCTQGTRRGT